MDIMIITQTFTMVIVSYFVIIVISFQCHVTFTLYIYIYIYILKFRLLGAINDVVSKLKQEKIFLIVSTVCLLF